MFKILEKDQRILGQDIDYVIDYGRGRKVYLFRKDLFGDRYSNSHILCDESGWTYFKSLGIEFVPLYKHTIRYTRCGNYHEVVVAGFDTADYYFDENE